ncbi:MAG: hypothetical protein IAE97_06605 [Chthoniobacterales bacterium]|nr:hypothetical protein [Chthoniobacterales bacterium]
MENDTFFPSAAKICLLAAIGRAPSSVVVPFIFLPWTDFAKTRPVTSHARRQFGKQLNPCANAAHRGF